MSLLPLLTLLSTQALAQDDAPEPSVRATLPLGYGVGNDESGFAWGFAGTLGAAPFSMPVYLVIAKGGDAGGLYVIGGRYQSPAWVFVEALIGYVKVDANVPASLGFGGGFGLEIPVTKGFAITACGVGGKALDEDGGFFMGYGGPTMRF